MKPFFVVKWPTPAHAAVLPRAERLKYWSIAAEVVLARKDWELVRGLNKDGRPLARPSSRTRRRRRSRMTASGVGDPSAPLFQPGNELSRTRSLLTSRGYEGHVRVWWRYDPHTGGEWGEVLARWAEDKGPRWDVLGLSMAGVRWSRIETDRRWEAYRSGDASALPAPPSPGRPLSVEAAGRTDAGAVDLMGGARRGEIDRAAREGRFSGWMTPDELTDWWRSGRTTGTLALPSRTAPGVRAGSTNAGLRYTWEVASPSPAPPPGILGRAWDRARRLVGRLFSMRGPS